jgi:tetratricopeptide (TPR) repeat protein
MRRFFFIMIVFTCCFTILEAQKSKVISLFQLIESGKYEEAKTAIEEAVEAEKSAEWPVTWYTRGLLCQTAYEKGIEKNNKKHYELYPDQLYVAYESYEKALELDSRGRMEKQLPPLYVMLSNNFQQLGEKHFKARQYKEALRAFEQALQINQSPIISVEIDSNLIYNTALAAYESKEWEKAITYLTRLNESRYSANISHLLYTVYLEKADTVAAVELLSEDIHRYSESEDLVLLLADLLLKINEADKAVAFLDTAAVRDTSNYIYPYTKGLVYQKREVYRNAIEAYKTAIELAPDKESIYVNIGTCYYNIGVEIEENARTISNNRAFMEEKAKSEKEFASAVQWLEEAHERYPDNQAVIEKLYSLYKVLGISDKIKNMEAMIH